MVPRGQATGQNLVWYASEQVVRGVLRNDINDIAKASQRLQQEVTVRLGDGIQPDMSFHQHSAQLYTGGYGLRFLMDSMRMSALLADTPWAYAAERLSLLADYTLEGVRPLMRGAWLDWSARGREFTREQRRSPVNSALPAIQSLAQMSPTRRDELAALVEYIEKQTRKRAGTGKSPLLAF